MDPAGVLAQFIERTLQSGRHPVQLGVEFLELGRYRCLGRPELQREGDELLLRAVVQVALDAAPGLSAVATMRAREVVSSACVSALAIAVATSSVNPASRVSASAGSGSADMDTATTTPHSRPSTLIGTPADERRPEVTQTAASPASSP